MQALEILTGTDGKHAVAILDPATGELRELRNVQSVIFVDGSVFPAPTAGEPEPKPRRTVQTLAGEVEVG